MNLLWKPLVYLIGAGPGDPGLLTRRGGQCLARADVILYDNLTNRDLLGLARADAEKIYVGKKAGEPRPDQAWINSLLIEHARAGRVVARFKGGDSFVFGRGGEEAAALLEAGIPFEVVPGVSSALAVPALAGIPVTQRGINTTLHILTGYEDPDDPNCSVPWDLLAQSGNTIVVLMGSIQMNKILARLAAGGLDPKTPLAVIHRGSYENQKSIRAIMESALASPDSIYLPPPSITVIGKVAGLDERLNWFERRPLFGFNIVFTRGGEGTEDYADKLREAGARVVNAPAIAFEEINESDPKAFLQRVESIVRDRGWLILPSPTAIRFFFEKLDRAGLDARALQGVRVAVIGDRSAEVMRSHGIHPDFIPVKADGATLAATLPLEPTDSKRVLIAGSHLTRNELPAGLRERGFDVAHDPLYETIPNTNGLIQLAEALKEDRQTVVLVYAPSAAGFIKDHLTQSGLSLDGNFRWIAMGPTTYQAMKSLGYNPRAMIHETNPDRVLTALAMHLGS